jgi:hypothetical protein
LRFDSSLGSLIGIDGSLGVPAQALKRIGNIHTAHQLVAQRISLFSSILGLGTGDGGFRLNNEAEESDQLH